MTDEAKSLRVPSAKIGNLSMGRLICGSNLIGPNMHARDLLYMNTLARRYNTAERVFKTLRSGQRSSRHGLPCLSMARR